MGHSTGRSHHDDVLGKSVADTADELDEVFWVTVGHVQAHKIQLGDGVEDLIQLFEVGFARTRGDGDVVYHVLVLKSFTRWIISVFISSWLFSNRLLRTISQLVFI